jgi:hypothetical protein
MASSRLAGIARHSDNGRLVVRIFGRDSGELVLADPETALKRSDLRELDGLECMQLAAAATEGPPLVVESVEGDYLVLPEADPDTDQHLPLNLDDAEVLSGPAAALGRFGRRTDDVIALSPWAPDHFQVPFELDDPAFDDVPVVEHDNSGTTLVRGDLDERARQLVADHLGQVGEDGRFGVFHNVFGEFAVYRVGDVVEPHNDLRTATVIDVSSLIEGSETLVDCALRLRLLAERMELAQRAGWTLAAPASEGYVYPERNGL